MLSRLKVMLDKMELEQERDQLKRALAVYENTEKGTNSTLALKKENQRLRDALQEIANSGFMYDVTNTTDHALVVIAKQALKEFNNETR